jgi:5-dehydro-2-deoxygluconokinase
VLTAGRVSVDLYPEQIGVRLEDVRTFRKMLGGSPTNVAVAAARLGLDAAVVTKVGAEPFGTYVRQALATFGVDAARVSTHDTLRTPLAFCEIFPPDDFPLLFYREPKAPDLELVESDFGDVESPRLLWVTVTGLSAEPSRTATLAALARRGRRAITVLDLDYRAAFWSSPEEAGELAREALGLATVAVGNAEEVTVAVGSTDPAALLATGVEVAVVKRGGDGVVAATREESVGAAPLHVDVVNGLGAGDAFGGALCFGLLAGWPLRRTIEFANAAGAIVASRLGCADDMPSREEVEALCTV